jgi:hypothetical protein
LPTQVVDFRSKVLDFRSPVSIREVVMVLK